MKIKIEHIPNTYNYGSLMMAVNTINKIHKEIENVEFYVDTSSEADFERLKKETGIKDSIYTAKPRLKLNIWLSRKDKIKEIIKIIKEIREEKKLYDVKIVLGGDDISEYYGKSHWRFEFPIMYFEGMCLPTILLGQSIGPFTDYRRKWARIALNKSKIYVRDNDCLNYLKELGVKTAYNGRDLAFLDLPIQSEAKHILDKYSLVSGEYIVFVTSALQSLYTKNSEDYIKEHNNIIEKVLSNKKLENKKIVILPHVTNPDHSDDRRIIREVMKNVSEKSKKRIIAIDDEMLASEAREIVGNGLFTITGRMHAAVSTFFMRKPALSLSYSVKYAGVIGDGLDMKELIIECGANDEIWKNEGVSNLVSEKVDYMLDNYDKLVKKIDSKVTETTKVVEEELDDLVKFIKKSK